MERAGSWTTLPSQTPPSGVEFSAGPEQDLKIHVLRGIVMPKPRRAWLPLSWVGINGNQSSFFDEFFEIERSFVRKFQEQKGGTILKRCVRIGKK